MLLDTYIKNSLIPKRYLKDIILTPTNKDLETFRELNEIRDNIKQFVDNGNNLLICSRNAGNGKTTIAVKLLKAYINEVSELSFTNNTPALFINVNNFINDKKLAISDKTMASKINQIEKNILTAKLVIFDDIADKSLSEYDMNAMYYWLDYRTANLKSCIFTSNMLPEQLAQTLSGKVYSRVVNYSNVKYITDGDHRSC